MAAVTTDVDWLHQNETEGENVKCKQLIQILNKQADESYACSWDNVGLLVGSTEKEIKKVYIALDASDEAVNEAIAAEADFLLTHHPLIFQGMKRITEEDFIGRRVTALIRSGISYYAMHTNFDVMGMAQLASKMLHLKNITPLEVTCESDGIAQGIGRTGELEQQMTLAECCALVKTAFDLEHVKVFGNPDDLVERAAICPGAGKSNIQHALQAGAQVYITGDIDHHTGIDAVSCGMAVIDAGHYGIEHIFIPYMAAYIREHAAELIVAEQGRTDPFQIV